MIHSLGIQAFSGLPHHGLVSTMNFLNHSQIDIATSSSVVAIPVDLPCPRTLERFSVHLSSGASTGFRLRIVLLDSDGHPSGTLADPAAEWVITAEAGAWNAFTLGSLELAGGSYWFMLDSPSGLTSPLRLQYSGEANASGQIWASGRTLYWTGSAWANVSVGLGRLRARLLTSEGWEWQSHMMPQPAAAGLDSLIMDTSENPLCRGNRFKAPWSGPIIGVDWSFGNMSAGISYEVVMADQGCTVELARKEMFHRRAYWGYYTHPIRFASPVDVVAETFYDVYIKAGSLSTASTGVGVTALDVSEESGAVVGSYGVTPGDVLGLYVNQPPTEGGSDSPTTTMDHVFPMTPVYGSISTGSGPRNFW